MATRRPDMVEHAVAQVARQRGVADLELVLAPHGFEAAPPGVDLPVRLVPAAADVVFGDVLNAAVGAARGELVLKMDDDDWYSPDFVADLLRARSYSGAELVGAPDDVYYLEDRDLTLAPRPSGRGLQGLRRGRHHADGPFGPPGAGRVPLTFPVTSTRASPRAVRDAGGSVYRIHGLGYVLRRTASGHTWDADLDDLVARAVQTWKGFHPGRLMEL